MMTEQHSTACDNAEYTNPDGDCARCDAIERAFWLEYQRDVLRGGMIFEDDMRDAGRAHLLASTYGVD
jgi:hypothetical protein